MSAAFELASKWLRDADTMENYGDTKLATVLRLVADELRTALASTEDAVVTPAEAKQITGYSSSHLCRMARDGGIENHGTSRRPRFRVGDLPRKAAARRRVAPSAGRSDSEKLFRDIVASKL